MRPVADITAEIDTVEARLAALKRERIISMIPADWPELILLEVREAFATADWEHYGESRSFALGDHVRIVLRVDVNDPNPEEEEPFFGDDEGGEDEPV